MEKRYALVDNNMSGLVAAAKNNDQAAITELYKLTVNKAYFVAKKTVKDDDAIQDILQDAYVKAFSKLDTLQNDESFEPWLFRIVSNLCINHVKKINPVFFSDISRVSDTGEEISGSFEDDIIDVNDGFDIDKKETREIVNTIIDRLPEDLRMCILLKYVGDLPEKEIADQLGVPLGTVKSRVLYAKRAIKKMVLELESKGTKLYSMAPIAFFLYLLQNLPDMSDGDRYAVLLKGISAATAAGASAAGASAATGAGTAAGTTSAATASASAAGAAAAGAGLAAGKIAIIVVAGVAVTAAVGTGVAVTVNNLTQQSPTAAYVETGTMPSQDISTAYFSAVDTGSTPVQTSSVTAPTPTGSIFVPVVNTYEPTTAQRMTDPVERPTAKPTHKATEPTRHEPSTTPTAKPTEKPVTRPTFTAPATQPWTPSTEPTMGPIPPVTFPTMPTGAFTDPWESTTQRQTSPSVTTQPWTPSTEPTMGPIPPVTFPTVPTGTSTDPGESTTQRQTSPSVTTQPWSQNTEPTWTFPWWWPF